MLRLGIGVLLSLLSNHGVAVGADVIGVVVVGRQGRLNKLRIPNDGRFVFVNQRSGWCRSRKNARCWWREQCDLAK